MKIDKMHWFFGLLMMVWAGLFVWFGGVETVDIITALLLAVTYFLWGITYHLKHGNLHLKNVTEYFLIGLIGFVLLAFVIS